MTFGTLPYGLRDVKLKPFTTGETLGASVDLPNSRTFSFEESEDFEELRGDDKVVAIHGKGPGLAWDLEAGGISFAALAVLDGGTITTSGTTPAIVTTYSKKTTDAKKYFQVEGQSIADDGGDFHCIVYKCKATGSVKGEMSDGTFLLTQASGSGIGRASDDKLYDFIQNETVTAIA